MQPKRKKIKNKENDPNRSFISHLNESPKRFRLERRAQEQLCEISQQCLYNGWQDDDDSPVRVKQVKSQKNTLDSSFRIKHIPRVVSAASQTVNVQKRAKSIQNEFLKDNKLMELNFGPRITNYPVPAFRSKHRHYFLCNKEQRVISGMNSLMIVQGLQKKQ